MKRILKICLNFIFILVILAFSLFVVSSIKGMISKDKSPDIFGYRVLNVLSGSMSPVFNTGDIICIKKVKPEEIRIGDIVSYRLKDNIMVTHRVMEIVKNDEGIYLKVKGDANKVEDEKLISINEAVGEYVFRVPYGGYIVKSVASPLGLILFLLIPGGLLIKDEIAIIFNERKNIKSPESHEL